MGGLVTFAVEYVQGRVRQAAEARAAARLLRSEFVQCKIEVGQAIKNKEWGQAAEGLPTQEWAAHKSVLATALSTEEWMTIALAVDAITEVNLAGQGHTYKEAFDDDKWVETFQMANDVIDGGVKALAPIARG